MLLTRLVGFCAGTSFFGDPVPTILMWAAWRPFTYFIASMYKFLFDDSVPTHSPGSKYTLKTRPQELGVDVREELLKYHAKYYSSNLMTLAIVGKGLDTHVPL